MLIERPRGVVPRARGCGLGPDFAQIAENIKLSDGLFEPWRQPVHLLEFPERVATAHVRNCCWTGTSVCDARYLDAGIPRKTYLSAPSQRPVVTADLCDTDWSYLGYPTPDVVEVVLDTAPEKSADTEQRTYVITYGTDCEEGPASCPTDSIEANKDSLIGLQLPQRPDDMWGATTVNIYRSQSLWDSEQGLTSFNPNDIDQGWNASTTEAEYFLIAELPIHTPSWVDDGSAETGRMLRSQELIAPKEGTVLVGETASGSLVGFHKETNTVMFSERNKYWGFPYKTAHTFPSNIQNVCVCKDTVFVLTDESPFILQDSVDCKDSTARPVTAVKDPLPAFCTESCVTVGDGIVYSSTEGLVYLRPDGSHTMTSRAAFAKDQWQALGPSRIRLEKGCEHLFVYVPGDLTYVWSLSLDESGYLPPDLTTLTIAPAQWLHDAQGRLYILSDNAAYEFNAGDHMQMRWRQIEQRTPSKTRVSAIRGDYVKKDSVHFNILSLYRNGTLSVVRELTPKGSRIKASAALCTQLELKGTEPMCWIGAGAGLNSIERRE